MVTTSLYSSKLGSDGDEMATLILGRRSTNRETECDNLSDSVGVASNPAADVKVSGTSVHPWITQSDGRKLVAWKKSVHL